MQIVIDIPEDVLKRTVFYREFRDLNDCVTTIKALERAVSLPKGHGRLIDADETLKAMNTWDKFGYTETGCFVREPKNDYVPYVHYQDMVTSIVNAPTIIEGSNKNAKLD